MFFDDPGSYTSWAYGLWWVQLCWPGFGWKARRIATTGPPGCGLGNGLKSYPHIKISCNKTWLLIVGNRWHCALDKKEIDWLLNDISTADFQINFRMFQLLQLFILLSNCLCRLLSVCFIYFCFSFYSFTFLCACVQSWRTFVFLEYLR